LIRKTVATVMQLRRYRKLNTHYSDCYFSISLEKKRGVENVQMLVSCGATHMKTGLTILFQNRLLAEFALQGSSMHVQCAGRG
jgi:hypothetical protein